MIKGNGEKKGLTCKHQNKLNSAKIRERGRPI